MAPQSKARLSTVEEAMSGSEDDLIMTANATSRKQPPAKRAKPSATRRPAAAKTATKRKAPGQKTSRVALKDKTNLQDEHEVDEVDEFDDEGVNGEQEEEEQTRGRAKRAKTTASSANAKKRQPASKRAPELRVIPESQPEPQDVSQSIEVDPETLRAAKAPTPSAALPPTTVQPLLPRASARSASVQPLIPRPSARSGSVQPPYQFSRERSGSVSDATRGRRGGDPELRRRLNELTKKHEDLNVKYQSLQEIGREEEESNFEKLRRATDQKTRDANDLVASLKKEIAELRKMTIPPPNTGASEIAALQKQVTSLTTKNAELVVLLEEQDKELQTAHNEIKSLEAKVVAARQQLSNSASQEGHHKDATRGAVVNISEGVKELRMKENLYSDLTGLLIRGVKCKEGEDEYDCIQTGRNGTLHFHLTVANDSAHMNPQTPSGLSWEDAEFAYDPYLDDHRDRKLLELLPEFLTDGICFPRSDAVKFYSKVLESMTKKIVVEE